MTLNMFEQLYQYQYNIQSLRELWIWPAFSFLIKLPSPRATTMSLWSEWWSYLHSSLLLQQPQLNKSDFNPVSLTMFWFVLWRDDTANGHRYIYGWERKLLLPHVSIPNSNYYINPQCDDFLASIYQLFNLFCIVGIELLSGGQNQQFGFVCSKEQ